MIEIISTLAHNAFTATGMGAAGVSAFRGTDGDKLKQNVAIAMVSMIFLTWLSPAWFGIKAIAGSAAKASTAAATKVASTTKAYGTKAYNSATGAYKTYVQGPMGDLLNRIGFYESGNNLAAIEGGGNLALDTTLGNVEDFKGSLGGWQFRGSTRNKLAPFLGFGENTPFVTPETQIPMAEQLVLETGIKNPDLSDHTILGRLSNIFCVLAGSPNGAPAAACVAAGANPVAPIGYAEGLRLINSTRLALGVY